MEKVESKGAAAFGYADDISAICDESTQEGGGSELDEVHKVTKDYERMTGGEVSDKKSFTFGRGRIDGLESKSYFCCVGAPVCVGLEGRSEGTKVERERVKDATQRLERVRKAG